jgi:hypothetical protein
MTENVGITQLQADMGFEWWVQDATPMPMNIRHVHFATRARDSDGFVTKSDKTG